jgi:hypothetical protein
MSKKSALDYVDALQKHTSAAFPQQIPVSMGYFLSLEILSNILCRTVTRNFVTSSESGVILPLKDEQAKHMVLTGSSLIGALDLQQ